MIFSLVSSPASGSGQEPVQEGIKVKNKSREIIHCKESSPSPPAGWLRARTAPETISVVCLGGRFYSSCPGVTVLAGTEAGHAWGGAEPAGSGGGERVWAGAAPRRRDPRSARPLRGRFSRGFLLAGRKAGGWEIVLLLLLLLLCRAFVLCPSRRLVERGLQTGIVSATVCGTVLKKEKKECQNTQPQPSSKFPVNTAFSGRIKL